MKTKSSTVLIPVLSLALLISLLACLHRSGTRSTLERYRAELLAHGEKLSLAEIAISPSTNPAHIAAMQILATNRAPANPVLVVNLMTYAAPGTARPASRGPLNLVPGCGGTNVPAPTWEDFVRQTAQSEPLLNNVRNALENPPPDIGWVWQDTYQSITNWPGRTFLRDRAFCWMLYNAVIADLHSDNLDAAIANLHALTGLAQMNRNEIVLGTQMIRIAIAEAGLGATWEALQAPGWDEPRLASLQHDWEQVRFLEDLERSGEAARAEGVVIMTKLRNSSFRESADFLAQLQLTTRGPWVNSGNFLSRAWQSAWAAQLAPRGYRLLGLNEDELVQLRISSQCVENLRALQGNRPWPEVLTACTNALHDFEVTLGNDHFGRLKISAVSIPNWGRAIMMEGRTDTQRKLTITDIAILRYQLKHAALPPDLAALTPEYLGAVPIDPMSGKPLCYRKNADGSFVLYSTGEDGKDDGGDPSSAGGHGTFGLWGGRDAVWPSAAAVEEKQAAGLTANERH